jgi:ABC-type nickel/cobalt efflux system permease component RcnA
MGGKVLAILWVFMVAILWNGKGAAMALSYVWLTVGSCLVAVFLALAVHIWRSE